MEISNTFKDISDDTLLLETLTAAQNEKSATLILLEHLCEVEDRRLFAARGYSSMWEYVHKSLGYSEAQASERVSAMRLMKRVPDVRAKLCDGELTLTTAAKLAAHVRREKCDLSETRALLESISGQSSRKVEKILIRATTSENFQSRPDTIRLVGPETTRITIDVDAEFLDLLNRVKELGGHAGSKPQELFQMTMKDYVKKREVKTIEVKTIEVKKPDTSKNIAPLRAPAFNSRYIAQGTKTTIRVRSGDQCEYIDKKTSRRCESKSNLEFDHCKPFAAGGTSTAENMRHLCRAHNQFIAIQYFGREKFQQHLKF